MKFMLVNELDMIATKRKARLTHEQSGPSELAISRLKNSELHEALQHPHTHDATTREKVTEITPCDRVWV